MKTSNFQIWIIVIFIVFLVVGVLIFADVIPVNKNSKNTSQVGGVVLIWGTAPTASVLPIIQNFANLNKPLEVYYVQKRASTYEKDLVEGFASGTGPDVFMISNDMLTGFANKVSPIPYASYPARTFQDSFVSGSDIYMSALGILALPIAVDPLVLYYNIDAFNSAGISATPATWDAFRADSSLLTAKENTSFRQSGAALGTFDNVSSAKEILYAMFMQSGSSIIAKDATGKLTSDVDQDRDSTMLDFYMQFADSSKDTYSWNGSFKNSSTAFISSELAQYIGFASEISKIQSSNPNLHFSIAKLPQMPKGKNLTYGKMYGLAISKTARNPAGALRAVIGLTAGDTSKGISKAMGTAAARKEFLSGEPKSNFDPIVNASAFIARSVIEPGSEDSTRVWRSMVNGIRSGAIDFKQSIRGLDSQLDILVQNKKI